MQTPQNTEERWSPILGYGGIFISRYEVSDHGRIRSLSDRRPYPDGMLKQKTTKTGYKYVTLPVLKEHNLPIRHISVSVSRCVALAFVDNPNDYPEVDHIDNVKANNHYTNLQWMEHDKNVRKNQAYTYRVWHVSNPEDVRVFMSRRQVELFIAEQTGVNRRININYVLKYNQGKPDARGYIIQSSMLRGEETFAGSKNLKS